MKISKNPILPGHLNKSWDSTEKPRKYWINAQIRRLQIRSRRDSLDPMESYEKLANNYENYIFDHWINRAIGIHYFEQQQDSLGEYYLGQSLKSENLDLPTKQANYRDLAHFNFAGGNYVTTVPIWTVSSTHCLKKH